MSQISEREAYARAESHRGVARTKRSQAQALIAEAERHERWAQKWTDWADDDYGNVPYPLNTQVDHQHASPK
jgi:hypothetical protein